jgi:hypothetical protein
MGSLLALYTTLMNVVSNQVKGALERSLDQSLLALTLQRASEVKILLLWNVLALMAG